KKSVAHAQVAQQRSGEVQRIAEHVVDGDRAIRLERDARHQVVLQVPSDTRKVRDNRNSARLQQTGIADSGKLEQLRRTDRAGGEQHLAPRIDALSCTVSDEPHATRALSLEDDAARD